MSQNDELKSQLDGIVAKVVKQKSIVNYEVNIDLNVNIGDGFVGHFYMADILDKDTKQVTPIAIKKTSGVDFDFNPVFKNEVLFYAITYPEIAALQKTVHLPRPFDNLPVYLLSDLEPKKEYIVMENLKAQGFTLYDKQKFLDREHLKFIFEIYGRFHALSFMLKKRDYAKFKKCHEGFVNIYESFLEQSTKVFEMCIFSAVDGFDHESVIYEDLKDLPKYTMPTLRKAVEYNGQYSCTTHGDCWSNNMMFKYSESGKLIDMKLIDFQLARENTPIHDLSYFFYSGACKADMDILEDYLKIYHKSFSEVVEHFGEKVEDVMSYDVLLSEWKENALLGVLLGAYLWQIKLLPTEQFVDSLKKASEDGANLDGFMKIFEKITITTRSETFKERVRGLLIHAYEFGVIGSDKIVRREVEQKPEPKTTDTHL